MEKQKQFYQKNKLLSTFFFGVFVSYFLCICSCTVTACGDENSDYLDENCVLLPPENLSLYDMGDELGYRLSWDAVSDTSSYELQEFCDKNRRMLDDIAWDSQEKISVIAPAREHGLGNKGPDQICYYRIHSCNEHGCGQWKQKEFFITSKAPNGFVIIHTDGSNILLVDENGRYITSQTAYRIQWEESRVKNIVSYQWQERSSHSTWPTVEGNHGDDGLLGTGKNFMNKKLNENHFYRIRTCSQTEAGNLSCGPWSSAIEILLLPLGDLRNPYILYNYTDLKKVKNNLNGHYRLGNNIDASESWREGSDACVAYTGDMVTATCSGFEPIGDQTNPFKGSINGAGYKIENLYINRKDEEAIGLFGYINSGENQVVYITNLGLENAQIFGYANVGGFVGSARFVQISNSYVIGTIGSANRANTGGLVGFGISIDIFNSYTNANVTSSGVNVGGGIGYANTINAKNFYKMGSVRGGTNIGGIFGFGYLINFYNGYVTSEVFGRNNTGAFTGFASNISCIGKGYFVDSNYGGVGLGFGSYRPENACLHSTTDSIRSFSSLPDGWSADDWDLGTSTQLPALKYAQNPNYMRASMDIEKIEKQAWCRSTNQSLPLPICGILIPNQR